MAYLKGQDVPAGDRFTDHDIGALLDLITGLREQVAALTEQVASVRPSPYVLSPECTCWHQREPARNCPLHSPRSGIACPTGEHLGTVCTHPRAEGAE